MAKRDKMSSSVIYPRYSKQIIHYHIQKLTELGWSLSDISQQTQLSIDRLLSDDSYFHAKSIHIYRIIQLFHQTDYHRTREIAETITLTEEPNSYNAYLLNSCHAVEMFEKIAHFISSCYPDNQVGWEDNGEEVTFYLKQHPLEREFSTAQGFLTYIILMLKALGNNDIADPIVGASSASLPDTESFYRYASKRVTFNTPFAFIRIRRDSAFKPVPTYNSLITPYLLNQFTNQFPDFTSTPELVDLIQADIKNAISKGDDKRFFSIDFISARHGFSRATLYRKLLENNTSFTHIVDSIRKTQSKQLLHDNTLTVSDISSKLGYANLSAFNRAFHRWFDISPAAFRTGTTCTVEIDH